jgi:hypothetical protein
VQRRGPEEDIGQQPGDVDGVVGGEGVGLGEHGEAHVAGQHDEQRAGQQPEGGVVDAGADQQPGHQREQQHVGRRVGDGDDPANHGEGAVGGGRLHEEHPRQQAEPGGDDGGVDQAGPVPARGAGADEQHQTDRQRHIPGEVEAVGARGKRVGVPDPLVEVEQQVTGHEQQLSRRQPPPGHGRA